MSHPKKSRPGAVRKKSRGKTVGSGGQGRQALEGRGPTPKAEDRPYHPAGKAKTARERLEAAARRPGATAKTNSRIPATTNRRAHEDNVELVVGRNAVLEALRVRVPATALYLAARMEVDARVREILTLATRCNVPVREIARTEIDQMTPRDSVHQGVALAVPPYDYVHPLELIDRAEQHGTLPLVVALDGVTDPRNLGAIIRSVAAFGGHGVVLPKRRSAGVTAAAWKASAGAVARVPVAVASNLTQTLNRYRSRGAFVVGLDSGGTVPLPQLELIDRPLVVVIGNEGKGISRLVSEQCDAMVSIPMSAATESLNASVAASITLYEITKLRGSRLAA